MNKLIIVKLILASLFFTGIVVAKDKKDKTKSSQSNSKDVSWNDAIKDCEYLPGLFPLYQDTVTGKTYLQISKKHLANEYIYVSHVLNGLLDAGSFTGYYGRSKIFAIEKYFDKIDFYQENTNYYFDPNNAMSRAAHANINRPLLASEKIVAQDDSLGFLIEADKLFLAESFEQIKSSPKPKDKGDKFSLGNLSKDKNRFLQIDNYPENTELTVQYTFEKNYPTHYGREAVTDARSVNITVQHSLLEVPENDFQSRPDDARIGFFMQRKTDLTSTSAKPYRDVINRWNLQPKNSNQSVSEPVEPIVFWMENTTPVELRPIVRGAVLQWNDAFEKAGIKNAIVVKQQPDTASWNAGDIRYNVLRWTSSPNPPFGGYGPVFTNPRTGQILGADIMFEYVFFKNRVLRQDIYDAFSSSQHDPKSCLASSTLQVGNVFAKTVMETFDMDSVQQNELVRQSLYYLVMHEVGHTLGLSHNFKGSTMLSLPEIHDKKVASDKGLYGSVMDYPWTNISPEHKQQGLYAATKPGPYDYWAIEYAYSRELNDQEKDKARLLKILSRSHARDLAFGNGADDMNKPGKGIDPRIMLFDMSSDPIGYSIEQLDLVNATLLKLKEQYQKEGDNFHNLANAYHVLIRTYRTFIRSVSRWVAGVYIDRTMIGQTDELPQYRPVEKAEQLRALNTLSKYAFAPEAFEIQDNLYPFLQYQRRGWDHFDTNEDPNIHERALNIQKDLLNHLLHKNVLRRISDTHLYGNEYPLSLYLQDLTDAIFEKDMNGAVNSFRRNLQVEYVNRLVGIAKPTDNPVYNHLSVSGVFTQLERLKGQLSKAHSPQAETRVHRKYLVYQIKNGLYNNK